ncbi:MAG: hypothetical protein WC209_09630 [Ignavibacteriaceae bacterium]|jgi:hypothetical protein
MILVSISSTEEKFVIQLRHKIDYVVEKNFGSTLSIGRRGIYLFVQLFFSLTKLIYKESFGRIKR